MWILKKIHSHESKISSRSKKWQYSGAILSTAFIVVHWVWMLLEDESKTNNVSNIHLPQDIGSEELFYTATFAGSELLQHSGMNLNIKNEISPFASVAIQTWLIIASQK